MNREIKFRAWDKKNNAMMYGNNGLVMFVTSGVMAWQFGNYLDITSSQDRYELMQFTGLHDKNGKEIYEGDYINIYNKNGVVYGHGLIRYYKGGFQSYDMVLQDIYSESLDCEVIGNIHEKPKTDAMNPILSFAELQYGNVKIVHHSTSSQIEVITEEDEEVERGVFKKVSTSNWYDYETFNNLQSILNTIK